MTNPRPEALTQEEKLEELRSLDSTTVEHLKLRARKQLYFMAKGVMGYKDVNTRTHGRFCRAMQSVERDRRLFLMPRSHLKSSIGTEADSVRLAVDDPDGARILIVNEILGNSVAFLGTIKAQFEKNEFLRFLFPELILDRFSGPGIQWSTEGATIPRKTTHKEPTWLPLGTGGAATSKHFTRIKADDIIGLEARKSPAVMRAAIEWNRNIEPLLISAREGIVDWIGTRWARNDVYADLIARYGKRLQVFSREAIEAEGIIFPEKFTMEWYQTIMDTTPDIWASQYMNNPLSDFGNDFDVASVQFYKWDNDGNLVFSADGVQTKWHQSNLDRVITVDPNSGSKTSKDEAAVTVSGLAPDNRAFVLESYGGRPTASELVEITYKLCKKWRPRVVGFEQAGQQNTLEYFKEKMRDEKMYFLVKPLKHMNRDKDDRIRTALEPIISTHRLYIARSMQPLLTQIKNFPDNDLKDRIDSLAYAVEEWRRPMSSEQQKKNTDAVNMMLNRRDPVTGYSKVQLA